jgi:hypothetical protein
VKQARLVVRELGVEVLGVEAAGVFAFSYLMPALGLAS